MTDMLRQIISENRDGRCVALPSVCSANHDVLRAAMLLYEGQGKPLLIEATSNQVNQDGGYTGKTPVDFVKDVKRLAAETGFPEQDIIFGGDHLGPQAWKSQPAVEAMEKARVMVAAYVAAGFTKIHLDCSEGCAGEPAHLDDTLVAARAADLAGICEKAAPDAAKLSYIVGTEVPVPGGARVGHDGIVPTDPKAAAATMQAHLAAFAQAGLAEAVRRIVGLVVQPGVEFGALEIDHLPATDQTGLRAALDPYPGLTFEAHSTDYQHLDAYPRLAGMGFAIHKVGPALTFAYRQALYALDGVDAALGNDAPRLPAVMEQVMLDNPRYLQGHYEGDEVRLRLLRHYSYSDRIRYYWPQEAAQSAVKGLFARLKTAGLPDPLLLQFFSPQTLDRAKSLPQTLNLADRLVLATVQEALAPYYFSDGALK